MTCLGSAGRSGASFLAKWTKAKLRCPPLTLSDFPMFGPLSLSFRAHSPPSSRRVKQLVNLPM